MARPREELNSFGEKLKKRREELGFSLDDLARTSEVPVKYLQALEEDKYDVFSAKVYAQGFLKKTLRIVWAENQERIMLEFNNEWDVRTFRKRSEAFPLPENRGREPYFTPKSIILGTGAILLAGFLIFSGLRLTRFISSPELVVYEPRDEYITDIPSVRIYGQTTKESLLTVNGREITIDSDGNFDENIEVAAGLNALEFIVKNRFGKTAKEIRYILVK